MRFTRLIDAARAIDRRLYQALRLDALGKLWHSVPLHPRKLVGRYAPVVAVISVVALYSAVLPWGLPGLGEAAQREQASSEDEPLEPSEQQTATSTVVDPISSALPPELAKAAEVLKQAPRLATQNVCGEEGVIQTGPVQFPYAPRCVTPFSGDNGGGTYRGVTRDRINIAVYISTDPVTVNTTKLIGGCGEARCAEDYYRGFVEWFNKYYERYGRLVEITRFKRGGGSEANVEAARSDAQDIIDDEPKVFAVLGGPRQAGNVFAQTLANAGVMCFCTAQVPEAIYADNDPFTWATLPSSTQAYIHRAEFIGKRLAGRKAIHGGDAATKAKTRRFGLIWFNNDQNDYRSGVEFFKQELKRYGVELATDIEYRNIEGCQLNAGNMVLQMIQAEVTSVIMATDPVCPISITESADKQLQQWEWIVTGSYLTDANFLARLYNQNQWSRAFGLSLLYPEVKDENEAWHRMYKEVQGNKSNPSVETTLFWPDTSTLFTGIHLAGPRLTPQTFKAALASADRRGGTVTVPLASWGPKKAGPNEWWDHCAWDDAAELWWDPNAIDPNGRKGAYRWPNEGKRFQWGEWASTDVSAFQEGIIGFDRAPDQ